ncbi:hypothetical protein BH09BAC4_BH09BAC4_22760 [soil metagenome]
MKTKWLFPHQYRLVGWFIFVPSAILGLAMMYGNLQLTFLTLSAKVDTLFEYSNLTDELAGIGTIIGLFIIAFSREKVEDEMISQLRLEALQWSVYANYIILIIAILTMYDTAFFNVMIYNMFTVLIIFLLRFRFSVYRLSQSATL